VVVLVLASFSLTAVNVSAAELIADAGGPYVFDECELVPFDASGSSGDPPLQYRWLFDGEWTGWSTDSTYGYFWQNDFHGFIQLEVTDGVSFAQDTAEVTIVNVAPFILNIAGPLDPVNVGEDVLVTVDFIDGDPRVGGSLDLHYATFYWGDGSSTQYDIASGIFSVTGSYAYPEAGEYTIEIILQDEHGDTAYGYFYVTIVQDGMNPVEAGPDGFINEGDMFVSTGFIAEEENPDFSATVDYGDGSEVEPLELLPGNVFDLIHLYCENGEYTVLVMVYQNGEEWNSDTATVTVLNVAPMIISLSGPIDPVRLDVPIWLNAVFTDPGCLDTHVALIEWGDDQTTIIDLPVDDFDISESHLYSEAGVYRITLTVTDDDGGSDSMSIETYIVVYDPNCGFVTGGGWIIIQPGSYPADPSLSGRCNFGFVSKYKKGQSVPEGNTEFQFQVGDVNFHSHTYEWLVIIGPKAMYKGTGTINHEGNYGFQVTVIDGKINGGGGIDKFRIKIWDKDNNNEVVFDNNLGLPDDADPVTMLSGGQITIHKK